MKMERCQHVLFFVLCWKNPSYIFRSHPFACLQPSLTFHITSVIFITTGPKVFGQSREHITGTLGNLICRMFLSLNQIMLNKTTLLLYENK